MFSLNKSTVAALLFVTLSLSLFPSVLSAAPGNSNSNRMKEAVQAGQALNARARIDLSTPAARKESVRRLKERSQLAKQTAEAVARERDWKIRGETSDGVLYELMAIDESGPVYYYTRNANAAISTGVDKIRNVSPYNLNGSDIIVGIWDGGSAHEDHVELSGRVIIGDGAVAASHATHVAGTIGAAGLDSAAQGMLPLVELYSCNATNDLAEMTAMAANSGGSKTTLYLSNHSYGPSCGWVWTDASGNEARHWFGMWGNITDLNFGRYGGPAQNYDTLAYNAGYYLPVIAIGNERPGNSPATGDTFYYKEDGEWHPEIYDPTVHPPADSAAYNGYKTLCYDVTSKNALVVGAVNDAVDNGVRLPANGTMTSFSSWGPTEDGRIKPDVVGNGASLYSSRYDKETPLRNDLYGPSSGTSMAAPNVTGTAALLTEYYSQRFPGHSMRASTLKGLLIHTADDLGNPGPDYQNGWGLVNGYKAVQLLQAFADGSESVQIIEGVRDSNVVESASFSFISACDTPVRVTLVWPDPPGAVLENDLDLRLIAPDGTTTYLPFVLNPTIPSDNAGRGDNFRDNVEQIFVETNSQAGLWEIRVSHKGLLYDGLDQSFSLIIETSLGLNDSFYSPQVLTGDSGQLIDCSFSATLETDEPNHGGVSWGKSMWYSWTAIDSGTMYLDTLRSLFNTVLAVYTGEDLAGLTEIAANDDLSATDQHSAVSFAVEEGVTYYIAVDGTGGVSSGKVVLNWELIPYPENDDLRDHLSLQAGVSVTGTNRGATVEEYEPLHAGSDKGHSVWWKWVSKEGWVTLDSTGSDFDAAMAVYYKYGSTSALIVENLEEKASIDDSNQVTFYANEARSYYIAVASGQNSGETPEGNISLVLRPANDNLEDALLWEGYENKSENAFLEGTGEEPGDPRYNGQPLYNTIWWTWSTPAQVDMELYSDVGSPVILGVYTKTDTGELVEVASGESGNSEILSFTALGGKGYYILAAGLNEVDSEILTVRMTLEQVLNNALFSNAISLDGSGGQVTAYTGVDENKEPELDESLHAGVNNYKSIWWTWSPAEDTFVTFDTFGSDYDTVLAVYTGDSLGNLTEVTSNNDYGDSSQSRVSFCAAADTLYYIVVASARTVSGQALLNWEESVDQKLLTLFKDGSGSVLVDGVERTPLWTNWYSACSRVSLEALPDTWQHYHFEEWQDDAAGTDAQIQVTMETNKSIRAVFAEDMEYTVTVASADGGEIYVDGIRFPLPWSGPVYEGKNVVLRPIPATDMAFSRWSGDISSQDMPLILTVTGDVDLVAEFTPRSTDKIITIEPAHDTTLYEDGVGETGNGSGDFFFAGEGGGTKRRGLIFFDLEKDLSADAVITSGRLHLVHSAAGAVESTDLFAARMSKAWGEGSSDAPGDELSGIQAEAGDATWLHNFYADSAWDSPGGDLDLVGGLRGSLPLTGPNTYTWLMADGSGSALMLADLQEWQQDPATNLGWGLFLERESYPAKRFHSREHPDEDTRPKLELTYYTARSKGPLVSIDPLVTTNTSPSLNGRVDDTLATLTVAIDGKSYTAANEGNGEWIIDGGIIDTLGFGTYSVTVEAVDSYDNRARDTTNDELSIVKDTYYNETCVQSYRELQRALALAETNGLNDRIMLEKGVYPVEQNIYYGTVTPFTYHSTEPYSLVVEGGYEANCLSQQQDPEDPEKTVIDGGNLYRGLDFRADGPGGTQMLRLSTLSIRNGSSSEGGGANISSVDMSIALDNCIVDGNFATSGGGLYLKTLGGSISLTNCLLVNNSASNIGAGALLSATNGEILLVNNSVTGNFLANGGLGAGFHISLTGSTGSLDVSNTIFWGNVIGADAKAGSSSLYLHNPDWFQAELHNNYLYAGTVEGAVTLESDTVEAKESPFKDALHGNYHLIAGSDAIDRGLTMPGLPVFDFEGDDRVIAGTCGGKLLVDIGVDEAPTFADPKNPHCLGTVLCYLDSDSDGYGSVTIIPDNGDGICLSTHRESAVNTDCNDTKDSIHPGAAEIVGDGVDQDCNGTELCFLDSDHDTFGGLTVIDNGNLLCTDSGESSVASDCNDNDMAVYPGAREIIGDTIDQDCDGGELCYRDNDGDSYGTTIIVTDNGDLICLAGDRESTVNTDCNDSDSTVYPGATEIAGDGVDQDCSDRDLCYQDDDGDSYGTLIAIADNGDEICSSEDGESAVSTDCNDNNPAIHPGTTEIVADGVDQDCNGTDLCYRDSDGDRYGSTVTIADDGNLICTDVNESELSTDCNDNNSGINPAAVEICDGEDNNCDSLVDENGVCEKKFWILMLPVIINGGEITQ